MKLAAIFLILVASHCCVGVDIYCDFIGYDWNNWGQKYICSAKLEENVLRSSLSKVTVVHGEHDQNRSDEDVLGVEIHGQKTFGILKGLTKFFPNMDQLYVFRSDLKFIQRSDFKGYKQLKTISLSRNHLSHLPYDAFEELTNVEYFSVSFNQLTQVPNVSPMKKLKSLYLFENSIEVLTKEDLSENLELEVIWLYHNKLKYIEASAFEQLPKLRVVDLTHNRCIDMKRNQYDQLPFYNAINDKCSERPVEENEIETLARSELF